jgi:hypothetical protein
MPSVIMLSGVRLSVEAPFIGIPFKVPGINSITFLKMTVIPFYKTFPSYLNKLVRLHLAGLFIQVHANICDK